LGDAQRELGLHADRANVLAARIATLNRELAGTGEATASHAAVLTQRTAALNELAREVDVRTYGDSDGMLHVTLAQGQALVNGTTSQTLSVDAVPGGGVKLGGTDVTQSITTGAIGGIIAARDATILPALSRLDSLAAGLAATVNQQHKLGFDLNGVAGTDIFATGPATGPGTVARGLQFLLSDGAQIAAAATPAPGDGANAQALAALADNPGTVTTGATLSSYTAAASALSYQAGTASQKVQEAQATAGALHDQAVAAREALSGVSLDEEAADMIRYQRAYQASARFLATVDQLLSDLVNSLGK
jgi:flagellar hook-associated protein 1 FlgK